jgi:hypothetical protein
MNIHKKNYLSIGTCLLIIASFCMTTFSSVAQDATAPAAPAPEAPVVVKNTFSGNYIIDNQTVMVPKKHSYEFIIQHRFGTIINGYNNFYGLFGTANARFGFTMTPVSNLQLGFGICKEKMQWDGNLKYALMRQKTSGINMVSVTYYGNFAVSTLPKEGNFASDADRYSYFHQLIVARKITDRFSAQVAPSISYFNNIEGYQASDGTIKPKMNNMHVACAFAGKFTISDGVNIIANYDQPITEHATNNPHPNVSFGFEFGTSGHTFQLFMGNYQSIIPQANNVFNQNDYTQSRYCIGFNITRRWYY